MSTPWRVLFALIAVLVLAGSWPVGAAAAPTDASLQVSVDGAPFTSRPAGGAFAVDGLAPGGSTGVVVGVRSKGSAVPLSLQLIAPRDDGNLGRVLEFSIAVATGPQSPYCEVWTGGAGALAGGVDTGVEVGAGADRWIRLTARVPAEAGDEVSGAAFGFGLRIQVTGDGVEGVSIGGASAPPRTGGTGGSGAQGVSLTGVPLAFLLALAAVLGGAGGLLLVSLSAPRRPR